MPAALSVNRAIGWIVLWSTLFIVTVTAYSGPALASTTANAPILPPDSQPISLAPGQKVFPYRNPVYQGSTPDPAMLRVGEYIYTAATGERIMRSRDLVHWEVVGNLFSAGKPAWAHSSPEIWAPDLNYINGKYVVYFTARAAGYSDIYRGIGVAWSDRPEGPYHPAEKPFAVGPGIRNIDPMAFLDDDGKRYLYWGSGRQPILVQELAADGLSLVGEPKIALEPDPNIRYSRLVEGTWVIKRGGYYYIFWSGDGYHPGLYAVSVARSTSPFGPFERYWDNPIIKESVWWTSPGHNSLIQDDAGQDWLVYHAYDTSDTELGRLLLIDKLIWKDGWPTIKDRMPSTQPISDGPIWNTSAIPLEEVAFGKPCIATSEQDRKEAVKAVDGNTYSGWLPAEDDTQSALTIDLGEIRRVARVELRFRKPTAGDMQYRIEISRDGTMWQVYADRTNAGSTSPYIERNEATGRYIRVSNIVAPSTANATLYEARVFAYQNVWIASPDAISPVASPVPIEAHIDNQMQFKSVTMTLDGKSIYRGTLPPANPVVMLELADGVHRLTLTALDTNDTTWQHDLDITVSNSQIKAPASGSILQGIVSLKLATGYSAEMVRHAQVELIPLIDGELQQNARRVLHSGASVPPELTLDTLAIPDGAYDLEFAIESKSGVISSSKARVLVKNWNVLLDDFEPPVSQGWFGLIERKKTVVESAEWSYDTSYGELFAGDDDRRVWQGTGAGELIWSVPGVRRFTMSLYARSADLTGLSASVSADQQAWLPVPMHITADKPLDSGWHKLTVIGEYTGPTASAFLRLMIHGSLGADQLQIGAIEIAMTRTGE